jgi:Fe-S cluster assembly protein SufB
MQKSLEDQGVIFTDTDTALREYPELFRKYFATIIPPADNKFAALNSAVWSGGSFIYVPKGVKCEVPLQAYFRINSGWAQSGALILPTRMACSLRRGLYGPICSTNSP